MGDAPVDADPARAQLVADLQKNLEVLDRIYPKLKIDLVMVQGTPTPSTRQCPPVRPARAMSAAVGAAGDFSPSLVDQLSLQLHSGLACDMRAARGKDVKGALAAPLERERTALTAFRVDARATVLFALRSLGCHASAARHVHSY
jgi:hypothetical protein